MSPPAGGPPDDGLRERAAPAVPPSDVADPQTVARDEDARIFARLLAGSARLALVAVAVVFALVASGLLPVRIALEQLPAHWASDAAAWRAVLEVATPAWPALSQAPWPARSPGELACVLAIGALCAAPVPALAALALRLARRGDRAFAALAIGHLAVIVATLVAAFG